MDKVLLVILTVFVVLALAPVYLNMTVNSGGHLHSSLRESYLVDASFVFLLGTCFPMVIDFLLDMASKLDAKRTINFYLWERLVFLVPAVIPAGVFFFMKYGHIPGIGRTYLALANVQRAFIFVGCSLLMQKSRSGVWTWNSLRSLFVLLCAQLIFAATGSLLSSSAIIFMAISVVCLVWAGYLFYCYAKYVFVNWRLLGTGEQLPLFFSVIYFVRLIQNVFYTSEFDNEGELHVVAWNCTVILLTAVATMIPGRMARSLLQETERRLDLKRSFVRYISHEIRTPLNVACVGLALLETTLQNSGSLKGDLVELMGHIKEGFNSSIEILNDLLTYEKLTSSLMTLDQTYREPLPFVMSCFQNFMFQAQANDVSFLMPNPSPELREILETSKFYVDVCKMRQVFRNLASNALKFTPSGGTISVQMCLVPCPLDVVKARVQSRPSSLGSSMQSSKSPVVSAPAIASHTDRLWVRISVIDTGVGIARENLGKLFNEIVQFNPNELQAGKGSGLGLNISKGIVDLHGGRISAHSNGLGTGCAFSVDLPLFNSAEEAGDVENRGAPDVDEAPRSSMFFLSSFYPTAAKVFPGGGSCQRTPAPQDVPVGGQNVRRVWSEPPERCSDPIGDKYVPNEGAEEKSCNVESVGPLPGGELSVGNQLSQCPWVVRRGHSDFPDYVTEPDRTPLQTSSRTNPLQGKRILVVDDSFLSVKMVSMLLRNAGAICTAANNGAEAVEAIKLQCVNRRNSFIGSILSDGIGSGEEAVHRVITPGVVNMENNEMAATIIPKNPIDMVIMDNLMPIMSGPEAAKQMRSLGFHGPIWGLTGNAVQEDVNAYLVAGATQVFMKPLDFPSFQEAVEAYDAGGK